ncbi:Transcription factor-related family protein [Rhynchospora pubera]|uniref:Transcription factor-related family protein n=1 Tax=Rhynchospora pubera TaxID=906938 RepID=A0AAV8GZ48_9POAL|nr:Transcription factor-related family protein [Rhynchospora pubera]
MGSELRESLRRVCVEIGWSYAVFWKAIRGINHQMQLVWGEGYCERTAGIPAISGFEAMDLLLKEKVAQRNPREGHSIELVAARSDDRLNTLVYKLMVHQVHVLGEGIIGHAALTGNHLWVLQDNLSDYVSISKALSEMKQQFWAGVQTVAVVPVLPHGVLQLGSVNMVMEDIDFISQLRCMFVSQLGCSTILEDSGRFLLHGTQPNQRLCGELPLQPDLNSALNSDLFYTNLKQIEKQLLFPSSEDFKCKSVNEKFREMSITENLKQEDLLCPTLKNEGNDLYDILGLEHRARGLHGRSDAIYTTRDGLSSGLPDNGAGPTVSNSNQDDVSFGGLLSETDPDQLLDAIVSNLSTRGKGIVVNASTASSSFTGATSSYGSGGFDCPTTKVKSMPESNSIKSERCESSDNRNLDYKSQVSLWVENGGGVIGPDNKRGDELGKAGRKRPRPGENPRPRPKDRQLIQDRIKELREIVPNGEKCSIDALLEKTIKHMLFLQSVAKHADKLKEAGEPKISSKEGGLLLKDNYEGGATWAFEVGTQSMTCPIIVEDLSSPRQMLVEMLCKERGIFLEIADQIRGLGLTILKGVMEVRKDKVWARFAVEANKDVTRMEIFLALVHLLEPNAGTNLVPTAADNNIPHSSFYPSSIPATGLL